MTKTKIAKRPKNAVVPTRETDLIRVRRTNRSAEQRTNQKEHFRNVRMNNAYAALRVVLPTDVPKARLSKVQVLRTAISYMRRLQSMLRDCEQSSARNHAPLPYVQSTEPASQSFGSVYQACQQRPADSLSVFQYSDIHTHTHNRIQSGVTQIESVQSIWPEATVPGTGSGSGCGSERRVMVGGEFERLIDYGSDSDSGYGRHSQGSFFDELQMPESTSSPASTYSGAGSSYAIHPEWNRPWDWNQSSVPCSFSSLDYQSKYNNAFGDDTKSLCYL